MYTINDINKRAYLPLLHNATKKGNASVSEHTFTNNEADILLFPGLWKKCDCSLLLSLPTKTTKAPQKIATFVILVGNDNNKLPHKTFSQRNRCFVYFVDPSLLLKAFVSFHGVRWECSSLLMSLQCTNKLTKPGNFFLNNGFTEHFDNKMSPCFVSSVSFHVLFVSTCFV